MRTTPEEAEQYRRAGWWGDATVSDFVARWAADRPDGDAIVTDSQRLSWRRYDEHATEVAAALVDCGLRRGDRVAVWLPDGAAVHIAFVALERAGLTVVGIGSRAGDRELRHLLERTRAVALVSHDSHRGRAVADVIAGMRGNLPALRHHVVLPAFDAGEATPIEVDGRTVGASDEGVAALHRRRLGPDELFMINSTSGTTGMPKCVLHTQNRWMYFHRKAAEHGALGDEVILSALPAPFGFGLWTAHFTPAILGSPTVVMETFDPAVALQLIERERVTMLCCVSTQFVMLLNTASFDATDLSSLRVMFTGGEAIPYERALAFEERTGATVLQFFGSNETGLLSGTTLLDPPQKRLRTAGRPVVEMNVRLYDDHGVDVTATGRGQPAGRGPAMCLGYLDDAAANASLFTADGWMLMGDVCSIDDDGYLAVVGRTADIIIRGGKNISAAVVEDEVSSHPDVALAAAVATDDAVFGERVCVFVELHATPADHAPLSLPSLVDHLRARGTSKELFPEWLVIVDELPRSSGGKVGKGELRTQLQAGLLTGRTDHTIDNRGSDNRGIDNGTGTREDEHHGTHIG